MGVYYQKCLIGYDIIFENDILYMICATYNESFLLEIDLNTGTSRYVQGGKINETDRKMDICYFDDNLYIQGSETPQNMCCCKKHFC